jgi:hypothetical protein
VFLGFGLGKNAGRMTTVCAIASDDELFVYLEAATRSTMNYHRDLRTDADREREDG